MDSMAYHAVTENGFAASGLMAVRNRARRPDSERCPRADEVIE